ncbi:MerR family transcriptional regulator [Caenispirillum bisanense]|uniref:MerR family transcriptional regulator n=1 Tax=Caenispirillum bisanense TaxID=414052 RepID=UPI0031D46662
MTAPLPSPPCAAPVRMRIGELARQAAVTVRTIHHYEREGLLGDGQRSAGGHRYYGPDALARLEKIRQLKDMGLRLDEIADLIDLLCGDPLRVADRRRVVDTLRRRLAEADSRIAGLRRLRTDLARRIGELERLTAGA